MKAGYQLNPKQALADKLLGLVFVYWELFEEISQFFPRFLQFSKNRFKQSFKVTFDTFCHFYDFFVVEFFLETSSMISDT